MVWPARKSVIDAPPTPSLPSLILTTPRLWVRPPVAADAPAWVNIRRANRAALEPVEPTWPDDCLSEEFFHRRLKRQARDWHEQAAYSFILRRRADEALIGGINLNHVAWGAARQASVGYWLDHAQQGQGYMREALTAVIEYAFEGLGLHRIQGACLPDNHKSIALLRALGFEEEGFARSYYRINGAWEDHVLFGLIRKTASGPTPEQPAR